MQAIIQDLRYGVRMLTKRPGFTVVAVITLALGIGANTTIFSFVNGILLRSLPYPQPERLVTLDETALKRGVTSMGVSFPNFLDWREQNRVFEDVAAYDTVGLALTGSGEPEQIQGAEGAQGLFEILRVSPLLGRTFTAEEDRPNTDAVVILSYGLWQRRFGGDPGIIGQTLIMNSRPRTVIGIMPEGFRFPEVAEFWVPLALTTKTYTRNDHGLGAIARLKDGMSLEQARNEMNDIAERIEQQNPVTNEGLGVSVTGMHDALTGDYRQALVILLSVVACVLLIACANVANLMLVRATTRQKEVAIRAALGASRWRIVRQLLTESVMLAGLGGALGLLLAVWGLDLLLAAIPIKLPFWMKFGLDWRVLGFTFGVALLTGLVFGILPALHASRINLNETLKEGGRSAAGAGRQRSRSLMVVAEIALSLVLLIGAGLMMRSFLRLQHVDAGFNPTGVMTMRINLPQSKYNPGARRSDYFRQLMERLRAQPGVESAAAISTLPLSGNTWGRSLTVEGFPILSVGQAPFIQHNVVMPGYFRALGIPILEGRDFTDADTAEGPKITIVDERLARQYWPNESAIGKRIRFGPPEDNEPWHTIVGVVGAVRHERLEATTRNSVYLPHVEIPVGRMYITLRTTGKPESLIEPARTQIRALDPDLPITHVRTMDEVEAQSVWQPRLYTILFGVFAAVALLLAAVGLYGVMAYTVTMRTHEIGLRVALGARSGDVLKLIAGQGIKLALIGVGSGLIAALLLTRLMATLLFNTSVNDPLTFAGIALLLVLVALLACYLPARRATKVDPMVALRYE
ncbi:MAG TPA: ABC transporter permease [Blastocatellia bacterium]|nr:ABC transporter permease [Blastocatellia bacterium]